jgi:hypothetical protein
LGLLNKDFKTTLREMVRRGSELYKLMAEKFRAPKALIEIAVKISKFAILILKETADVIAKL